MTLLPSPLVVFDNCNVGGNNGDFFITVICSSSTYVNGLPLVPSCNMPFEKSIVWESKPEVPALDLSMCTFLGSFSLSVKNKTSSTIFIPVMSLSSLKFKTFLIIVIDLLYLIKK